MESRQVETSSDRLFQELSNDIIEGRLKPDEKISEPAVAKRFGTSRAPVREAVRRMEERGLVTRKPHAGCRVALFSLKNLLELFEIREALEGLACRLATEQMSDQAIADLKKSLEKQLGAIRSGKKISPENSILQSMDFHDAIARGCGNKSLTRLLCEDYYTLIKVYRKRHSWIGSSEMRTRSIIEHIRILEAMEERDGAFAEIIMRRHIASAVTKLKKEYQDGLQPVPE